MSKLLGAKKIIGTTSSEEKCKIALELGVTDVINYNEQNFEEEVKKITNNELCNVVYDGVGKSTYLGNLQS
jgi:NADPH:quinone reductase